PPSDGVCWAGNWEDGSEVVGTVFVPGEIASRNFAFDTTISDCRGEVPRATLKTSFIEAVVGRRHFDTETVVCTTHLHQCGLNRSDVVALCGNIHRELAPRKDSLQHVLR